MNNRFFLHFLPHITFKDKCKNGLRDINKEQAKHPLWSVPCPAIAFTEMAGMALRYY